MAAEAYYLQDYDTLDLETDESSPTTTPVAGIVDVELVANVSIERLFTADSIKVEEQKQSEFTVDVNIGFAKFDPAIVEQWLGGGGGTSANSMTDTSDPQKYAINTADFISAGGGTTYSINLTGLTFESMPLFSASQGEFAQWDLSGTAADVSDASTTSNP